MLVVWVLDNKSQPSCKSRLDLIGYNLEAPFIDFAQGANPIYASGNHFVVEKGQHLTSPSALQC